MAGEERTRIRRRVRLGWLVGLSGVGLALAVLAVAVLLVQSSDDDPRGSSGQVDYQARIRASRSALFPGTLHVEAERRVPVDRESVIAIWACGPDSAETCPTGTLGTGPATSAPGASPTGTGPATPGASPSVAGTRPAPERPPVTVPLGARLRIDLIAGDSEAITVRSVDAAGDPAQPLTERDDVANWSWFVRATRPGTYPLVASVSVLAADSETLLVPRERVDIELTVTRTGAYTAREATRGGWAVTRWVVGTVIALLGTGLITTATLAGWRRRGGRAGQGEGRASRTGT
ncbi:hypothetical protein [Micromonospora sp. NPDC047074]|uniref:hypothetical protein n=1 Tax=Micromonospora sp. NPDC047074 TaxID=3154339 RepID=UPI0033FE6D23